MLGVTATTIGIVAGFGELLGYGARLVSGYLGDRTGKYWAITIAGYLLNLFAVPLLALAGAWQIAVVLIIAERMGRGIRSPVRDAMLSHAASRTGLGWGFGLHQALDQLGAVAGPLVLSGVLFVGGGYQAAFGWLLIPAVLSMAVLLAARYLFPRPHDFELAPPPLEGEGARGDRATPRRIPPGDPCDPHRARREAGNGAAARQAVRQRPGTAARPANPVRP